MNTETTTPTAFEERHDSIRTSTRFGVAFAACQLVVMVFEAVFVLPHGGSPTDPATERGNGVLDAAGAYRIGNYVFAVSGMLLLGFLGAVHARLRLADTTGTWATIAVAAGTLLALVWPYSAVLHDVALDAAGEGTDVRFLAAWDAIPPYSLAFSVLPRIFFVGLLVLGLRAAGRSRRLQWTGLAVIALSAVGSLTLVSGAAFPVLALSSLGFEIWVGVLAWTWLRGR